MTAEVKISFYGFTKSIAGHFDKMNKPNLELYYSLHYNCITIYKTKF